MSTRLASILNSTFELSPFCSSSEPADQENEVEIIPNPNLNLGSLFGPVGCKESPLFFPMATKIQWSDGIARPDIHFDYLEVEDEDEVESSRSSPWVLDVEEEEEEEPANESSIHWVLDEDEEEVEPVQYQGLDNVQATKPVSQMTDQEYWQFQLDSEHPKQIKLMFEKLADEKDSLEEEDPVEVDPYWKLPIDMCEEEAQIE